jgi:DNA helicase II / ATP-dependent DNA helicase PcrA
LDHLAELERERAFTARVQQLLYAVIQKTRGFTKSHDQIIRDMLSDAWEELRMKPTALSPQDLEQLSTEIDRYLVRKNFSEEVARRYERMLMNPFFARIDFRERGEKAPEKIVIVLYSLKNELGELMVHDWRAPICSLYYDAQPGNVSFTAPDGAISGRMTLKRQYRMENGRLKYFVDTDVSIDDEMLLDILSRATSHHMRNIVSTIQHEQNMAIRHESARVLSVIGGAGSGKTSVAMHRAAYLMYHHREQLNANHIAVLSPGSAFSEYISSVLPDLGEENAQAVTLHGLLNAIIGRTVEPSIRQIEHLIDEGDQLRRQSVRYKSDGKFCEILASFAQRFEEEGPRFSDIGLEKHLLMSKEDLEQLYRVEFTMLSPALRLIRIQTVLARRMDNWEKALSIQYEDRLLKSYRGRELELAKRMAVTQHLAPIRQQIRQILSVDPLRMLSDALSGAPRELREAARENAQAGIVWWEDAPAIAWLMVRLGFAAPDKSLRHILIDEAQDYSDIALRLLSCYYPTAQVTLLGDTSQRTCPGMPPCNPRAWGADFQVPHAPLVQLTKSYRSTQPITRLCNALLPEIHHAEEFGREGAFPTIEPFDRGKLLALVEEWKTQGMKHIAVITRSQAEATKLAKFLKGSILLNGGDDDMLPEGGGVVVSGYHLIKGLEFDAVAVVWPDVEVTDGERRRLYTACSRALHQLHLMCDEALRRDLGIIL